MAGGKVDMAEINMIAKRDNLSKEEIEQLKKEWLSEIEAEAKQNDKEMEEMKQSYEEKLKAAQAASNAGKVKKIAWIQSYHLSLQLKFKLWVGKVSKSLLTLSSNILPLHLSRP